MNSGYIYVELVKIISQAINIFSFKNNMTVQPIHTQADYKTALREVSALIDIDPTIGTADADRLEVLGSMVEAYETKH